MTTIVAGAALDMTTLTFDDFSEGTVTSHNATTVVVDFGGGRIDTFTGTFGDFDAFGVPHSGDITGYQRSIAGTPVFTMNISPFPYSAADFSIWALANEHEHIIVNQLTTDDTITGSSGNDHLFGYGGNDTLKGGTGNDILEGEYNFDGFDFTDFSDGTSGITVNLNTTVAQAIGGGLGNDTLIGIEGVIGTNFNDTFTGTSADNAFIARGGNDTINGGNGFDTAMYSMATGGVTVNLNTLTAQAIGGGEGSDTLAAIENLTGSNFGDTLTGNAAGNVFEGLAGNDVMNAMGGIDTVSYRNATGGVTVDLAVTAAQAVGGGAGTDTISNFENLRGSEFGDTLKGSTAANVLTGRLGNDVLIGRAGNDTIDGGDNRDTASYADATGGVTVFLQLLGFSQAVGGGEGTDLLISIENLTGGAFNDNLQGDDGVNELRGGAGNDVLGGRSGADLLDGGDGIDTGDFEYISGVTVSLHPSQQDEDPITFISIENLRGGSDEDKFGGDDGANLLEGFGNDDTLEGRGGNDTLDGGAGIDSASYAHAEAGITLDLALTTQNVLPSEGTDTFISIEGAVGTAFNDTLLGTAGANHLTGGAGDDVLSALDGADYLRGGDGNDTLAGGIGEDILIGGDGNDALFGGPGTDHLYGDAGDDLLYVLESDFNLTGGEGYDQVIVLSTTGVEIFVNSGVEYIAGNNGNDKLSALSTNEAIVIGGAGGDDLLDGGAGNDILAGMDDSDTVRGNGGNDQLFAGAGSDDFFGGDGDDLIYILGNDDVIQGDAGYDQAIILDTAGVNITIEATTEYCAGNSGNDVLDASTPSTVVTLGGAGGDDVVRGGSAGDTMSGSSGLDTLYGNGGADVIFGGDDNDALYGGAGNDQLFGGNGADVIFVQDSSGTDSISGFVDGVDLFDFSLHTSVTEFSQLTISTLGGDALVDFAGGQLFIAGAAGLIEASDFTF